MTDVDTVLVSIPFIAGQWSLRATGARPPVGYLSSFNPLHCGAVVASREKALARELWLL